MIEGAPTEFWIVFLVAVALLIAADLILFRIVKPEAKTGFGILFVLLFLIFAAFCGGWIAFREGQQAGLEFASCYLIELSLSIDNLFVFLLMFRSIRMSLAEQRKVLLFGVAGAIVIRGLLIFAGIGLLNRFAWIQDLFGALLLVAALRLLRQSKAASAPGKWAGQITRRWGKGSKRLFLSAVIAIELVDLVFALDSIPAVLAISHRPVVVYSSNICAILGLRSLYFLLANLLERLRFLHLGLAVILGFVGCKMLMARWLEIPVVLSLAIIVLVAIAATAASLLFPAPQRQSAARS